MKRRFKVKMPIKGREVNVSGWMRGYGADAEITEIVTARYANHREHQPGVVSLIESDPHLLSHLLDLATEGAREAE